MIWTAKKLATSAAIFGATMIVSTILIFFAWEAYLSERVYVNTDDDGFGYLSPGTWVGNPQGFSVVVVKQIMRRARSMSDPDELKMAWTVGRLCFIQRALFGSSLVVSICGFADNRRAGGDCC